MSDSPQTERTEDADATPATEPIQPPPSADHVDADPLGARAATQPEPRRGLPAGRPRAAAGPRVSFGFNLGKIAGQGEDSDPIVRDGRELGLVAVFDGMGGAGGTVYETADGLRTGAYLASRVARDVVERRMLDLLEPDWNLKGEAAAEDLRRSVRQALE